VADADNSAGVREEPRIDTPNFAFTSSIDLRSITTDSISTSLLTTTSAAVTIAAPAGLGPVVAGVCEEPEIDIATFAFASSIDLHCITADLIPNSTSTSTTSAAAAAAPTRLGHRSSRGWRIIRKASSALVGRLWLRPSNMELKMGVESNGENSGSREGLSESTGGGPNSEKERFFGYDIHRFLSFFKIREANYSPISSISECSVFLSFFQP
jgi:hypothetical protein